MELESTILEKPSGDCEICETVPAVIAISFSEDGYINFCTTCKLNYFKMQVQRKS